MKQHYEEWHAEAKKLFDRPRWISVGTEAANPMILYSQDWIGDYCDNPGGLSSATHMVTGMSTSIVKVSTKSSCVAGRRNRTRL